MFRPWFFHRTPQPIASGPVSDSPDCCSPISERALPPVARCCGRSEAVASGGPAGPLVAPASCGRSGRSVARWTPRIPRTRSNARGRSRVGTRCVRHRNRWRAGGLACGAPQVGPPRRVGAHPAGRFALRTRLMRSRRASYSNATKINARRPVGRAVGARGVFRLT